jgi:hypothetical protein
LVEVGEWGELGEWEWLEGVVHHGGGMQEEKSEARTKWRGDGYKRGGIIG